MADRSADPRGPVACPADASSGSSSGPPRGVGRLTREERILLAVTWMLVMVTAWFSTTFFHPDEHYQVLEFVGYRLGFTPREALPWEFAAHLRPWLQPWLYATWLRVWMAAGLEDRFVMAWVLRLSSGLLAWWSLVRLAKLSLPWFGDHATRRLQAWVLALAGFFPYLAVRTSSENLSSTFFVFGATVLLEGQRPEGWRRGHALGEHSQQAAASGGAGATSGSVPGAHLAADPSTVLGLGRGLLAGVMFGLAFECRFQMAVLVFGLLAWSLVLGRLPWTRLALIVLGGASVVVASAGLDRWGYGRWSFPPWNYLRLNVFEGVAKGYGTDPWWGYLYLTPANVFAPVVLLLMVALVLAWIRAPWHVLTWTTLPFVAMHALLGHKEERFLFPLLPWALLTVGVGLGPGQTVAVGRLVRSANKVAEVLWRRLHGRLGRGLLTFNCAVMLLLAFYPLGWRPNQVFYRWSERHLPREVHFVSIGPAPYPDYPFLRRAHWRHDALPEGAAIPPSLWAEGPLYLVREDPFSRVPEALLGARAQRLFSEFPGTGWAPVDHTLPWFGELRRWMDTRLPGVPRARWLTVYRLEPK